MSKDKYYEAMSDFSAGGFKYENPKTGEIFTYRRKGVYTKDGVTLVFKGKADEKADD